MQRIYSSLALLALLTSAGACAAQRGIFPPPVLTDQAFLPDAPQPEQSSQSSSSSQSPPKPDQAQLPGQDRNPPPPVPTLEGKQTKRILGIIPNFRSVSVDVKLPPVSTHDKFTLMLGDNSTIPTFFTWASCRESERLRTPIPNSITALPPMRAITGIVSLTLRRQPDDGICRIPRHARRSTLLHAGAGRFAKRPSILSLGCHHPQDKGGRATNISEIVGNGRSSRHSCLYYPSPERTWTKTGQRWVTQIGLDGFANLIKEFWPDINSKIFHSHY